MDKPELRRLRLDDIRIDGGTQARAGINDYIVEEYAEALKADQKQANWPPIVVYRERDTFWLADGFHRYLAARAAGLQDLLAEIRDGTRWDALRYALRCNGTHGLRRTHADIQNAIRIAYENRANLGLPDVPAANMVADMVGTNHHTVAAELGKIPSWKDAQARTGADGKTRRLPPPPIRPPPPPIKPPVPPATPPTPPATDQTTPPSPTSPTFQLPPPAVERDAIGRAIPSEAMETWTRRQEAQDLLTALSRVRVALRNAQDAKDTLFAEVNFSSALAHLDQAYSAVEVAKPHTVCPSCQGLVGCKLCCGRRMISTFRWKTVCTDQQRAQALEVAAKE